MSSANDGGDASIAARPASSLAADAAVDAKVVDGAVAAPITPEARRTYWAALTEGRTKTVAAKYPDAIAAFTRALAAIPDDGRALSERGYARFLAKDLDAAAADFERALLTTSATDTGLRAQIEFNLGLVDEQRGTKGDLAARKAAGVHFLRSHELHPTNAAREKIPRDCTVAVLRPSPTVYSSTADAIAKIHAQYGGPNPSQAAGPASYLEVQGYAKVLLPIDGGRVSRVDVGLVSAWHCGTLGEVSVTRSADVFHVVYQAHAGVMQPGICSCADGNPCSADGSPGLPACTCNDAVCPLVCGGADDPTGWHIESFVDAKTGDVLWQVEMDHEQLSKVKLDLDVPHRKFAVVGQSCSP